MTYKEPANNQVFELLENSNEDSQKKEDQKLKQNSDTKENKDKENTGEVSDKKDKKGNSQDEGQDSNDQNSNEQSVNKLVEVDLSKNLDIIKKAFNMPKNQDIVIREFIIKRKIKAFIIFIEGMVDRVTINNIILGELMNPAHFDEVNEGCILEYIKNNVLTVSHIRNENKFDKIYVDILNGMTALFVDECNFSLIMETKGFEKRGIEKPLTETVIRGSQEGFTESLRTNLTMIRRIIKNQDLITEIVPLGRRSNTNCAIIYLQGIVNESLLGEVKRRINSIDIDYVLGDGMLEQFFEDSPFMFFPQVLSTERPDRATSFLMEGQVLIMSEGAPFVDAVPVTFFHMLHTSEDSFLRWQYGSLLMLIRFLAFILTIYLPGLYVALILYRPELIPTELLFSIAQARENIPFPTIIEALLMEISFELIHEAGIRVPGVIGQTLGIIGALILGQAAVSANLVSPVLIIIVAITGLGNFAIPSYPLGLAVRILRFGFIILGALIGFYGISIGTCIVFSLACSMKSFGVPFFAPIAPVTKKNADLLIRGPSWKQMDRPDFMNTKDRNRKASKPRGWADKKDGGNNK